MANISEVFDTDDIEAIKAKETAADVVLPMDAVEPPLEEADEKDLKEASEVKGEDDTEPTTLEKMRAQFFQGLKYALILLLVVYLLAAFIIDFKRAKALFISTVLCLAWNAYAYWAEKNEDKVLEAETKLLAFMERTDTDLKFGAGVGSVLAIIMVIIMAATVRDGRNLISLFGLLVFIALTWVFSWKPGQVKVRPIVGAIFIQFLFGYVVIRTEWGFDTMEFAGDTLTTFLEFTYNGSQFVFGWLTDGSLFGRNVALADGGNYNIGPPFFFNVLPIVIFFSSMVTVGYYLRIIPWLVRKLGYFLSIILGTSASESLSAAGNIFVGQTEAPLLVRPFMKEMTESELHAIMTGGFATIAGTVFGIYVSFGVPANAILAASVMSAPAALAISKIAYPETEESPTATGKKGSYEIPPSDDANVVHAAANGAVVGTQLMLNIAGSLIAFLAILEMLDALLEYLGDRVDIPLSFSNICEVIFYPVAWLMGVDGTDCREVAVLLGYKIFVNEFFAYEKLAFEFADRISPRSYYIASYALCGFSNIGSIGIQLGGLTPLAPNQGGKLAKLVVSAMIAGNTACLTTACIAGIFYKRD